MKTRSNLEFTYTHRGVKCVTSVWAIAVKRRDMGTPIDVKKVK